MRIHNIIKTVCLAGSLALLSACEDWLEIEPKDRLEIQRSGDRKKMPICF